MWRGKRAEPAPANLRRQSLTGVISCTRRSWSGAGDSRRTRRGAPAPRTRRVRTRAHVPCSTRQRARTRTRNRCAARDVRRRGAVPDGASHGTPNHPAHDSADQGVPPRGAGRTQRRRRRRWTAAAAVDTPRRARRGSVPQTSSCCAAGCRPCGAEVPASGRCARPGRPRGAWAWADPAKPLKPLKFKGSSNKEWI